MRNTRNIVKISEVNKHVDTGPALNYSVSYLTGSKGGTGLWGGIFGENIQYSFKG